MTADKNAAALDNMGLVHACCQRFTNKGIDYDELFSAGCLGLAKAINGFDEGRNLKFSTYAFPVIMGELKRLFRDGGALRVSRSLKELSLKINRLNSESRKQNGCELTISQLAQRLDVSREKIIDALNCSKYPLSLTGENDGDGNTQLDIPVDDIQDGVTQRLSLNQAINSLDEGDRKIISLRYYRGKTQAKTAEALNMTQVQISRREKKILARLRVMLDN